MEAAHAQAEKYDCDARTVDELLADDEIETRREPHHSRVRTLTSAYKSWKPVNTSTAKKPLGVDTESGKQLIDTAAEKGLRVGSAPRYLPRCRHPDLTGKHWTQGKSADPSLAPPLCADTDPKAGTRTRHSFTISVADRCWIWDPTI